MNVVRVADLPDNFPIKKSTLYIWAHKGRFPGLFIKLGGALMIDLEEWKKVLEGHRIRTRVRKGRTSNYGSTISGSNC